MDPGSYLRELRSHSTSDGRVIPARGIVLVKRVETEETLPGGRIIIPQKAREEFASHQVEVVAVGEPEICRDDDDATCTRLHVVEPWWCGEGEDVVHPIDPRIKPEAWVMVKPRSLVDAGTLERNLFFVRLEDILCVLTETSDASDYPLGRGFMAAD